MKSLWMILILMSAAGSVLPQSPPEKKPLPRFEAAAIKPSAPGGEWCSNVPSGALQLRMQNCTLRDLGNRAWSVDSFRSSFPSEPAWISSLRWDVTAKSPTPVRPSDLSEMLQPLLKERFRVKFHREMRQVAGYDLSVAKSGVKLPATKPGSCTAWDHRGPPPPPRPDQPPTCDYILFPGTQDRLGIGIDGTGVPMSSLTSRLSGLLERPVADKTGLTGLFDLKLRFTRESVPVFANRGPQEVVPGAPPANPSGLPSIFTALRAAGLRIDAAKVPVDVFVLDSAQKPSEN